MNHIANLAVISTFVLLAGCSLFDTSKTNDNTQAQISVQSTLITQSEVQIRIESGQEVHTFSTLTLRREKIQPLTRQLQLLIYQVAEF